jgi:hypothetical protein
MAGIVQLPLLKFKNGIVEGGETLLLIRRLEFGSSLYDGGDEKRFVDIDDIAGLINNFYKQSSFLKNREKPFIVPLTRV